MKKILAILLALTLVLSVGVAAMAEEETELWGEGLKIGLAQMHYTNAFRIAETESVISAFEAVGAEVVWNEAGNDTATQVANAKDLLAQDIDYLLLPPKEEAGLVPALDAAKEAGVPVILLDRSANGEPGVDYVTAIRSDAIAEGEWCAQWIKMCIRDRFMVSVTTWYVHEYRGERFFATGRLESVAFDIAGTGNYVLELGVNGERYEIMRPRNEFQVLPYDFGVEGDKALDAIHALETCLRGDIGRTANIEYIQFEDRVLGLTIDGVEYLNADEVVRDHIAYQSLGRNIFAAVFAALLIPCLLYTSRCV